MRTFSSWSSSRSRQRIRTAIFPATTQTKTPKRHREWAGGRTGGRHCYYAAVVAVLVRTRADEIELTAGADDDAIDGSEDETRSTGRGTVGDRAQSRGFIATIVAGLYFFFFVLQ